MADVQLDKGFTQLANELLEILGQFKFTRLQMIAITTVWRFSYGFHKLYADFPKQSDLGMYGIPTQKIGDTLRALEEKGVFKIDWDKGRIWFLKDYDKWDQSLRLDCFDTERHDMLLKYNKETEHIATVLGWKKASRGGGRKPARFTKSESTGSRKVNQADGNASKDKASTDIGSRKVNQNRFTKSESNEELGSRIVNQQVHETVIKAGLNPSNNAHLQPPKYRSKDNIHIYTDLSINTEEQGTCHSSEEKRRVIEFVPGVINWNVQDQVDKLSWVLDYEPWDHVLIVIEEAKKRNKSTKDRLPAKSVLSFIFSGLQNYERLYQQNRPPPKLTPKERAVETGHKILRGYQAYPEMIQSKRQLSTLAKHYEAYDDYGELINMPFEQFKQAIEGV